MAEIDDRASAARAQNTNNTFWHIDMDIDWEEDRENRKKAYERILAGRDPERIQQGIEAYKRDLPQMLRDQKERYVVAYDGHTQVGVAKTREKLLIELKQNGITEYKHVFIKVVSSLEDIGETFSSSNHR